METIYNKLDREWSIEFNSIATFMAASSSIFYKIFENYTAFLKNQKIIEIPDLDTWLSPTDNYFTGVIVDTRNYLTHYDDELKDIALKNADLYWANQRLKILISLMLLKEIGIQEKLILDSMIENNKIRQIIDKS